MDVSQANALSSSFAIGIVGDAGVRGTAQQPRLYVGMILILIFAEVLGKSYRVRLEPFSPSNCPFDRSLRPYRRSAHELSLAPRHQLLNQKHRRFCGWILEQPPSETPSIRSTFGSQLARCPFHAVVPGPLLESRWCAHHVKGWANAPGSWRKVLFE